MLRLSTLYVVHLTVVMVLAYAATAKQSQPEQTNATTANGPAAGAMSIPPGPIAIPQNAETKYSKRTMVLYMNITMTASGSVKLSPGGMQALKIFIETEMPRLKRFKIYTLFNDGAYRLVKELEDVGEVDYQEEEALPAADAYLNISMDIQVEKNEGRGSKGGDGGPRDPKIYYTVVTSAALTGTDRQVIDSHNFKSTETRKNVENTQVDGLPKYPGFDPTDQDSVNKVLQEAGRKQLIDLALWLGKKYPITCNITGLSRSGEKMGGDQGVENGLRNDVEMVIWGDDAGIAVALAAASVQAQAEKSTFIITRWNTEDPDAALWIKDIEADRSLVKDGGLMATTWSMPFPKEWMEAE